MKTFAYYVIPGKVDRAGNSTDKVTVIQIQNNRPRVLDTVPRSYRTPAQAAVDTAIGAGRLGVAHKGKSPARLFNDGIAEFYEL